jgi:hypothetical protein
MRNYPRFPMAIPHPRAGSPRVTHPSAAVAPESTPLDLHALGTPPALILSQDQTRHQCSAPRKEPCRCITWATRFSLTGLLANASLPVARRRPRHEDPLAPSSAHDGSPQPEYDSGLRHPSTAPACQRAAQARNAPGARRDIPPSSPLAARNCSGVAPHSGARRAYLTAASLSRSGARGGIRHAGGDSHLTATPSFYH